MNQQQEYIQDALSLLGIERLALAIHDQSFPSLVDEEVGRGSPYSHGGTAFLRFLAELGFNCLQLGPQGKTTRANPSPYDSAIFSKNEISTALAPLVEDPAWCGLLDRQALAQAVAASPSLNGARSLDSYRYAHDAVHNALKEAYRSFAAHLPQQAGMHQLHLQWQQQNSYWLEHEALFEALSADYGTDDWHRWKEEDQNIGIQSDLQKDDRAAALRKAHKAEIVLFQFKQFLVHQQHQQFRRLATECGIRLFGDVQIGFSWRDSWAFRRLFLDGYLLGAPPSRTNPDGQPWGYPLLDPDLYFRHGQQSGQNSGYGPALQFVQKRIDKLVTDFDGLRIDHPHGIVCPWVYSSSDPSLDPLIAVQTGARLFESPDIAEHPRLGRYAIASRDQLNEKARRYADDWVRELEAIQVEQYCTVISLIEECMRAKGLNTGDIVCEVLSSCPYPLKRVLAHKGLGRFRVTQKADPTNPKDVYRTDAASKPDWVMISTHDTLPIWSAAPNWSADKRSAWARYLANRLEHNPETREKTAAAIASNLNVLIEALFTDLFLGPAANVSIFFSDLLGMVECYNRPGVVSDENWVVSVPNDYKQTYRQQAQQGGAVNLPAAIARALKTKAAGSEGTFSRLADRLQVISASTA